MASDSEDYFFKLEREKPFIGSNDSHRAPNINPTFEMNSDDEISNNMDDSETPSRAVNEETGEINWDCPCLKSALEPPCGESFKAAFSCFVASKTEPKGIDCHDFFKAMQECFLAHPEKYGPILEDDDGEGDIETELKSS